LQLREQALQSEDVNTHAATVPRPRFGKVPASLRARLFRIVAADTLKIIRTAAARLILFYLIAYQHFLSDQDRKVETVIPTSSLAIRRLHPDHASLISVVTNPDYFRPVAKFKSTLIISNRRQMSDR
jgi:hypothetical protein